MPDTATISHRYTPEHWAEIGTCCGLERRAQPHDWFHGRNETMTLQNQHAFTTTSCPAEPTKESSR